MTDIREETPADAAAIAALHRLAFAGEAEAEIVERLRQEELVVASLVATDGGAIVGHILFSDLAVEVDGKSVQAVSLAPVAVQPARQRQGIGSRLIRAGLALVRERGRRAVIVLGHAGYYPRFGFSAALAGKLQSPFPGKHFMALELQPGALAGRQGSVRYPAAFGIPDA